MAPVHLAPRHIPQLPTTTPFSRRSAQEGPQGVRLPPARTNRDRWILKSLGRHGRRREGSVGRDGTGHPKGGEGGDGRGLEEGGSVQGYRRSGLHQEGWTDPDSPRLIVLSGLKGFRAAQNKSSSGNTSILRTGKPGPCPLPWTLSALTCYPPPWTRTPWENKWKTTTRYNKVVSMPAWQHVSTGLFLNRF